MKYTKEQRLNIGKQIYENELTKYEAAEQYNIGINSAREYMRLYRDANNLLPKNTSPYGVKLEKTFAQVSKKNLPEYEAMTKEELIKELIKSRLYNKCCGEKKRA